MSDTAPRFAAWRHWLLVAAFARPKVVPGGLTRVGETPGSRVVSGQSGAISKDTWVL